MNIFTQSRTFQQLAFILLFTLFSIVNLEAQLCLGIETRVDETKPDEIFLDVTTQEFKGIAGMQFSLLYDATAYEYVDFVEANLINFGIGDFFVNPNGLDGVITLVWVDVTVSGVDYTEDKPLFTFKFLKKSENGVTFKFSDEPTAIEIVVCAPPPGDCRVIYNFENCNTGENLSPAMSGQLYIDDNENCQFEDVESTSPFNNNWQGWNVLSTQDDKYYLSGNLRQDGAYDLKLFQGINQVKILPPSPYYAPCDISFEVDGNDFDISKILKSPIQITEFCPFLEVNINSHPSEPCNDVFYSIAYANIGTADAENVFIELDLDYRLTIKNIETIGGVLEKVIDLDNNQYRIEVGNLIIGERGFLAIEATIPCEISPNEVLRHEARIYPNEICGELNGDWSGASLKVNGKCEEGKVVFEVENVGNGDMIEPLEYVVIEDAVIFRQESLQLTKGSKEVVTLNANGASYFLQVSQEKGHPGNSKPSAFVEACGRDETGGFSTGFANRFPEENNDFFVDIEYQTLTGWQEANWLTASPAGFSEAHFIAPNNAIEYTLFFNNYSKLEIVDTLSSMLDIATFKSLSASLPYEYTVEEGVLKLNIPTPTPNDPFKLNGFIKFSIQPKADLPMGSVISNSATLYYFGNERIEQTNTVFHTLMDNFLATTTPTKEVEVKESNLSIYPNPSSDVITFSIKNEKSTDYHLSIFNIDGQLIQTTTFNSNTYSFHKGDLPGGTYLYRLIAEDGVVDNGLFVLVD